MPLLRRYLADLAEPERVDDSAFDELAAADGSARPGWSGLLGQLDALEPADLVRAQREVARLLEDDNVTYTPSPASTLSIADRPDAVGPPLTEPQPWRLDPLPLILDDREWSSLEAGVVQRVELLDAILTDLYGARRLLARQAIPAAAVLDHDEYLRPVVGIEAMAGRRLVVTAADLGRDATGQWKVISDRTQAPSGAGFAMQNRRVVSRVLSEVYHSANLYRLTPFFSALRLALVDAAPSNVEDPRVVVLSPGTHSETAFDQAFVASLLGFPLLEGSDLTVRDGRVWMRALGKLEQVDVILRRVDSTWMDALELRPGSRLGVTGLLECVRQGTVSVVNTLGSGVLENPALLPFLPDLCERLLGEPLRLPSVETWWCGEDEVAPARAGQPRPDRGSADQPGARPQRARPGVDHRGARAAGGEGRGGAASVRRPGDATAVVGADVRCRRLVRRNVILRSFAVRAGSSYTAMLGGLARVTNDQVRRRRRWSPTPMADWPRTSGWSAGSRWPPSGWWRRGAGPRTRPACSPPARRRRPWCRGCCRDLYWFGRYAERAEDLLRLIVATRTVAIETDSDVRPGRAAARPARGHHPREHDVPRVPPDRGGNDAGAALAAARPTAVRARSPSRSAGCRWPRRAYATSCPTTCGWCWPTSSVRWPRWRRTRTTRDCSSSTPASGCWPGCWRWPGSPARTWCVTRAGTCWTSAAAWSGRCRCWRCCG